MDGWMQEGLLKRKAIQTQTLDETHLKSMLLLLILLKKQKLLFNQIINPIDRLRLICYKQILKELTFSGDSSFIWFQLKRLGDESFCIPQT